MLQPCYYSVLLCVDGVVEKIRASLNFPILDLGKELSLFY